MDYLNIVVLCILKIRQGKEAIIESKELNRSLTVFVTTVSNQSNK